MPIDVSQQDKVFQWLKEKGVAKRCVACGHDRWEAGDLVASPTTPQGGGTAVRGPSYPLVQVICKHCAFVMHFASTPIGLEL